MFKSKKVVGPKHSLGPYRHAQNWYYNKVKILMDQG